MEELFRRIQEDFNSLWRMRRRGASIEITTPLHTCTDRFVSVFLTVRGDEYVVTDGGWIDNGSYDAFLPVDDDIFLKIYDFYSREYGVSSLIARGNVYHFKKTSDIAFLPNIVNDLARFVADTVTASQMQLSDPGEQKNRAGFIKKANSFIKEAFPESSQPGFSLEQMPGVRFSAKIEHGGRLTLVNYVTGSHPNYYISSIGKSSLAFDLLDRQSINSLVNHRVLLLDTDARAYSDPKVRPYIELMEEKTDRTVLTWSRRSLISDIVLN